MQQQRLRHSQNATLSLAPCAGASANDVWFQVTATDAALIIQLSPSGLISPVVDVNSIAVPGKVNQPLFIQLVTEDNVARTFKVF